MALLAAATVLAGCGSPIEPDRFYRLHEPPPSSIEVPVPLGPVEVQPFPARGLLQSERAILFRQGRDGRRIERHAHDFFEEAPADMVRGALLRCLRDRGPFALVLDGERGVTAQFSLDGRLLQFEQVVGEADAFVTVDLIATLVDLTRGRPILNRRLHVEIPAADTSIESAIRSFEAANEEICRRLLEDPALRAAAGGETQSDMPASR